MPSSKKTIKMYVSDDEHEAIARTASQCKLSMSEFSKRVCLGQKVQSRMDAQNVRDLLKINADLGRLGGLLKMWLTNEDEFEGEVRTLLQEIENTQMELRNKVVRL